MVERRKTSLYINADMLDNLKLIAIAKRKTVNSIILSCIEKYLNDLSTDERGRIDV